VNLSSRSLKTVKIAKYKTGKWFVKSRLAVAAGIALLAQILYMMAANFSLYYLLP